jgi:hypothetical protein
MAVMTKNADAEEVVEAAEAVARADRRAASNGTPAVKVDQELDVGPLFALDPEDAERHLRTRVYRLEPVDEGHLDDLGPKADRKDIKRRWGGGVYKVQAVTAKGKVITTDWDCRISGEPIFDNDTAKKRYAKWLEGQFGKETPAASPTSDDPAEARHRREMDRLRLEMELKEQAEERRRARDREEREAVEERRRLEAREEREREREERRMDDERRAVAEERRFRAEQEERRLDREARLEAERAAAASAKDPTQLLITGMKLATELRGEGGGGDGYPDAGTAFVANMPQIIESVRGLGSDIAASGGAAARPNPPRKKGPESIELEGALADKARAAAEHLRRQGVKNPEATLSAALARTFDAVKGLKRIEGGKGKPSASTATRGPAPARKVAPAPAKRPGKPLTKGKR